MDRPSEGRPRYRGYLNDPSKDQQALIDVGEEDVSRHRKKKVSSSTLFDCADPFFSFSWAPAVWVFITLAYLCMLSGFVGTILSTLPSPMSDKESATLHDSVRFIASNAEATLQQLIKVGPRTVGSYENEVYARNFIETEISKIANEANAFHNISIANQVISGSFYINQNPLGYISYYHNVQNVVARLSSRGSLRSSAVLVNCHFDSVPGSPGASDDAFHCAVMLELLRVLSLSKKPLLHDIIFLFNGAEESGLQASHGFIKHHNWAKDVKAFVNLEGCGAGGKEVLFQTGPNCPWLVETYGNAAPHPHGSVMGEELFQSGIIPSDTDFRIFRDFGKIPGIDFANVDNGFVYHTRFDNGKLVFPGSYQHTGDNILEIVKALADSPLLESANLTGESMVYYDVLGFFFFYYSKSSGNYFNILVFFASLFTISRQMFEIQKVIGVTTLETFNIFARSVFGVCIGWVTPGIYLFILTQFLNWMNLTQSWYRSFFYQFSLYYSPTILFCIICPFLIFKPKVKLSNLQMAQVSSLTTQFLWTTFLFLGIVFGIRSSYMFMILVLFPTLCGLGLMCFRRNCTKTWALAQLLQTVIPMFVGLQHTIMAMSVLVPITNRSGVGFNAEFVIALLSAATCILIISYLVPLSMLIKNVSVAFPLVLIHLMGLFLLFVLQPSPFYLTKSGESGVLQRVPLWHVKRSIYDEFGVTRLSDSGYWLMNMDRSAPHRLSIVVPKLRMAKNAAAFCDDELFCALPLYSPRHTNFVKGSYWIPSSQPFEQSIFSVNTEVNQLSSKRRRISFNISGPQQMSFTFSPLSGITAVSWSLEAEMVPSSEFRGRPSYFVFYQRGLDGSGWNFHIDFELSDHVPRESNRTMTVGITGSHIKTDTFTNPFLEFLNEFPEWVMLSPRSSEVKIWEL